MKYFILFFALIFANSINTFAQVHTTYLWHLQQPIYWPEQSQINPYHYQTVKESHDIKMSGGNNYGTGTSHPTNNLSEIFGNDDRKNIYQHGAKNCINQIKGYPEAGAQVSYSGVLIKNVNSLADANQWGYYSGWQNNYVEARGWQTTGGFPRLDIVGFTYHHTLSPLISERSFRMELKTYKLIYGNTFGNNPVYTKGFWPAECCFSERNIQILAEEGYEWSVIANSHLSRTLNDYPLHYGTNGCNISPPNKADKIATNGNNWWNGQIDGRGGEFAAPYCYQAHKAQYINPNTGTKYTIDVVPMCDLLSYRDGYSAQGTGDIEAKIKPYDDPAHPSIVLFAHDGDNAWGGGSSYYYEAVPNFVSAATNAGMVPTTIQQFLNDHPVPTNDIVHVEDGGWVNASNDWGHPQFINWLWPLYNPTTREFNPNGWTEDFRNWAVVMAAENYVWMAEDLSGGVDIQDIVYPSATSSQAELAWHFFLPANASCYMYYGTAEDMEVKQTIAGNNAISHAQNVITAHPNTDNTPPTVFIPQRFPYNPGGKEFGPIYGYQEHISPKDFFVWTVAYDVNGIQTATLKFRIDNDGENPLANYENETYAGGTSVGAWQSLNMTTRIIDAAYNAGNPDINFFVLPTAIANMYYAEITGLENNLVDYYVEMTDTKGNTFKTPIQHVWVGDEEGGGTSGEVFWEPETPTLNEYVTITCTYATATTMLHWGVNAAGSTWITPNAVYRPAGTTLFGGIGPAVETAFSDPDNDNVFTVVLGPFNNAVQVVNTIDFVIHDGDNWDNNGGSDYHITINNNPSEEPTSANRTLNMMMNETYTFENSDFTFVGVGGATFVGIKIITIETDGDLEYNNTDVTANQTCTDINFITFAPNTDETGTPYATFTFKVIDSEGRESVNNYTYTINVYNENPLSNNSHISIVQDETYTFETSDFPFTGAGGATLASVKIVGLEEVGTLKYNGTDVTQNQICTNISLLTYTPISGQSGYPYDNFDFRVIDSEGRESDNTYIMTINVSSINPTGNNSSISMLQDNIFTFAVSNFPYTGINGATFAGIRLISDVTDGTLLYDDGTVSTETDYNNVTLLTFEPQAGEFGTPYTTFTFKLIDNLGNYSTNSYIMTINVLEENQPAGVTWFPENPTSNDVITIFVSNDEQMLPTSLLHWGVNDWTTPNNSYWVTGSTLFNGTGPAIETQFVQQNENLYTIQIGPFNNPAQIVNEVNFVLHYGANWNNNGGSDWNIPITQAINISENETDKINIYPNPFTTYATVDLTNETGMFTVNLLDINGKTITTTKVIAPQKFYLNRGNLQSGVYFLQFVGEKKIFNKTLIIK